MDLNTIVKQDKNLEFINEDATVPKSVIVVNQEEAESYLRDRLLDTEYTIKPNRKLVPEERYQSTRFIVVKQTMTGKLLDGLRNSLKNMNR